MSEKIYGTSTVAMTAYNLVAASGQAMKADAAFAQAERIQLRGLTRRHFDQAVKQLVKRKLIVKKGGELDVLDPLRRVISQRDRDDGGYDDDGRVVGGWNKWLVMGGRDGRQLLPIEEAVR